MRPDAAGGPPARAPLGTVGAFANRAKRLLLHVLERRQQLENQRSEMPIEKLPEGVYLATSDEVRGLVAQGCTILETIEIARGVAKKLIERARLYFRQYLLRSGMSSSQKRPIQNYRSRLGERGLARFEVLGLDADRALIRSVARRLAEDGPDASRLRTVVSQTIEGESPKKGGILAALRRSPLVGADIDPVRTRETGRKLRI